MELWDDKYFYLYTTVSMYEKNILVHFLGVCFLIVMTYYDTLVSP